MIKHCNKIESEATNLIKSQLANRAIGIPLMAKYLYSKRNHKSKSQLISQSSGASWFLSSRLQKRDQKETLKRLIHLFKAISKDQKLLMKNKDLAVVFNDISQSGTAPKLMTSRQLLAQQ